MVAIDVTCHIEAFRRFLVNSTCRSFIPESYLRDPEVYPEKESEPGSIYIEAVDKVTLKTIRDISFVNANEVLGIIYTSKSGHSRLKWRQLRGPMGRVTGDASNNSLVNLSMSRVITPEYVEELMRREQTEGPGEGSRTEQEGGQSEAGQGGPDAYPQQAVSSPSQSSPPSSSPPSPEAGGMGAADEDDDSGGLETQRISEKEDV